VWARRLTFRPVGRSGPRNRTSLRGS
jgi:hypothetical protein